MAQDQPRRPFVPYDSPHQELPFAPKNSGAQWNALPPVSSIVGSGPGGLAGSGQHSYHFPHFNTQGATSHQGPCIPKASSQLRMPPHHAYTQHTMPPTLVPSDIPLPHSSDNDLIHGPTIASATGHSPASFVAGSQHSKWGHHRLSSAPRTSRGKGKQSHELTSELSSDDEKPVAKQGRHADAGNYTEGDLSQLLTLVEEELPISQQGWKKVHTRFAKWAKKNNQPERDCKSIETKYKQLIKPGKPTGSAKRPDTITRALKIEKEINERASTCDLHDLDFDNSGEVEIVGGPDTNDPTLHTVTVRSNHSEVPQPCRMCASAPTLELVQTLSKAFDLATQQSHEDDCASRSMQTTQFLTMSQQLHDANATIESLQNELTRLCNRFHDAERACDCAELKLELTGMNLQPSARQYHPFPNRRHLPGVVCVQGKIKSKEIFPEGGKSVTWITDMASSSSEKENIDPTTSVYKNSRFSPVQSHSRRSSGVDFTPPTFFANAPLLLAQEPSPVPSHASPANNDGLLVTPRCNGESISYIVSPIHVPGPEDK